MLSSSLADKEGRVEDPSNANPNRNRNPGPGNPGHPGYREAGQHVSSFRFEHPARDLTENT